MKQKNFNYRKLSVLLFDKRLAIEAETKRRMTLTAYASAIGINLNAMHRISLGKSIDVNNLIPVFKYLNVKFEEFV